MNKIPISAIILAHQDVPLLKKVVESVTWAEDILIYWTSMDAPPIWLKDASLHLVLTSIDESDFSAYRNEAASFAKEEILFFVDSDEVVDPDGAKKMETILKDKSWKAATIYRRDIFHHRELQWGEVRNIQIPRIFKKGSFAYTRPVHEIASVEGKIINSHIEVKHFAHVDLSEFLTSVLQYIQIEVELRKKNHEHVSVLTLFVWPFGKFFQNYFLRLGALDGWRGLIYAVVMSLHSFGLRASLYEQTRKT